MAPSPSVHLQPSLSAEGQVGRRRPFAGTRPPASATLPCPGRVAGQVERRSDMVRHGEFENLPSFRADR